MILDAIAPKPFTAYADADRAKAAKMPRRHRGREA